MLLRLSNIVEQAIVPALALLGKHMDTPEARVMLLAIGLQETRYETRYQLGDGPGRGYWQFEPGGTYGVWQHHSSHEALRLLCHDRDVPFDPRGIYEALEHDDVLAAGVARLLLFTDSAPLPELGDQKGAWSLYARCWRPGHPRPERWNGNYRLALSEVKGSPP